jgi:hypothetical protein
VNRTASARLVVISPWRIKGPVTPSQGYYAMTKYFLRRNLVRKKVNERKMG